MPKQLKEIKDFVTMVRSRKDIKQIRIKKTKKVTKFKVRTGYVTGVVSSSSFASAIIGLPC